MGYKVHVCDVLVSFSIWKVPVLLMQINHPQKVSHLDVNFQSHNQSMCSEFLASSFVAALFLQRRRYTA